MLRLILLALALVALTSCPKPPPPKPAPQAPEDVGKLAPPAFSPSPGDAVQLDLGGETIVAAVGVARSTRKPAPTRYSAGVPFVARPLARVVRQRDARRSISRGIHVHPSTDGKDGNGYADR